MLNALFQVIPFFPKILYSYKIYNLIDFFLIKRFRFYWLYSNFASCLNTVILVKIEKINGKKCISVAKKNLLWCFFFYLTTWSQYVKESPSLSIGANCNFGAFIHITCTNKMVLGNNVLTGKWDPISG